VSSPPPTLLDRENRGAGFGAMDAVNGVGDVIASADGAGAGVDAGEREPPPAEPLLRPLAPERIWTILDHMQRTSLVSANRVLNFDGVRSAPRRT
jgi:hypothetical protein